MQPTQSTGSPLLPQKGTAAAPGEACTLTKYSRQSGNRKGLPQICRAVQEQHVLWKDMPSLLAETDIGRSRVPSTFLPPTCLFFVLLSHLFKACPDEGCGDTLHLAGAAERQH
jgi:hypothetical protein